ncbi:MAG: DegT/DnrJ/EryC1/StrS family aminotransferase, partial [Acidimicrobiales bacterium]
YQHEEIGYNYRLSNLLAAVGRGQLRRLDELIARRRAIHDRYARELGELPHVTMAPVDPRGRPNHWLSVLTIDPRSGVSPRDVIDALDRVQAEARPAWKPMHLQPVWKNARTVGGAVAEEVFATGLCLPSGSGLTAAEQDRVVTAAREALGA